MNSNLPTIIDCLNLKIQTWTLRKRWYTNRVNYLRCKECFASNQKHFIETWEQNGERSDENHWSGEYGRFLVECHGMSVDPHRSGGRAAHATCS